MTDVKAFLEDFKKARDFKSAFPLLQDKTFRDALFGEIERNVYPYSEYASWIAEHFFEKYPAYFPEWSPAFRRILFTIDNHTVQRNLVHTFVHHKAALEDDGEFLELLIGFLSSAASLPALKVNAYKAIEKQYLPAYPELITELGHVIALHKEDTRPSIRALVRSFYKRYSPQLNPGTR